MLTEQREEHLYTMATSITLVINSGTQESAIKRLDYTYTYRASFSSHEISQ